MAAPDPVDAALVGSLPLFAELGAPHRQAVAAIAERVRVPAETVLFAEGDPSDEVYVVAQGRVALSLRRTGRDETLILTVGSGELLGWSALLPLGRRVATGRTVEPTELLRLHGPDLRALCERDHDVGYAVMKQAVHELARRLHDTRLQMLDVFAAPEERA
ncbi:MAG: cyclic nucleotide-binding domain-containing protein [Myxococcota bacterium]